jgi:antitoxin CptB
MSDDLEARRRRAAYRATHRGTKEMDITLGRFAAAKLASMSTAALERFERLLALPDPELQGMIWDPAACGGGEFAELIAALRVFHGLGTDGA